MADQIDLLTERLVAAFEVARDRLADAVEEMVRAGTDPARIVTSLADPTLRAEIGLDRESIAELFEDAATTLLTGLPATAAVTPEMLEALTIVAQDSFLAATDRYWSTMQRTLTDAVLTNTATGVRDALKGIDGLQAHQVEAAFNTTLNTYSRSVGAEVARNDPPNTKYTYEGPVDDRTRDECIEMASAGALTKAEIDDRFPGAFIDGGGYNCRHSWVPVAAADDVNTKQAERERELRKSRREAAGKEWKPLTPRQQAEARGNA